MAPCFWHASLYFLCGSSSVILGCIGHAAPRSHSGYEDCVIGKERISNGYEYYDRAYKLGWKCIAL